MSGKIESRHAACDLEHIHQLAKGVFGIDLIRRNTFYDRIAAGYEILCLRMVRFISDINGFVGVIISALRMALDIGIEEDICNRVIVVLQGVSDILPDLDPLYHYLAFQTVCDGAVVIGASVKIIRFLTVIICKICICA